MTSTSPRSFRNDPKDFLPRALAGFIASHPDARWDSAGYLARRCPVVGAAREAADATADLAGNKGRASYLGDRARGVVDPGALVVAWLFGDAGQMPAEEV